MDMTTEFEKTENGIKGRFFNIPNIKSLIDENIYELEQSNLGTSDIECPSADTSWEMTGVNGGNILFKFSHKLWRMTVDGENVGNIEYEGLLSVDVLTGEEHAEIYNKTEVA